MSFTLKHYKDGKPVAVKLSIWDAFKGVPHPRPRRHRVRPQRFSNVVEMPILNPPVDLSLQYSETAATRGSARTGESDKCPYYETCACLSGPHRGQALLEERGTQTQTFNLAATTCPCCNHLHSPSGNSSDRRCTALKSQANTNTGDKAKQSIGGEFKANMHSKSDKEEYSAQDNAKIIEMKNENATWAKILEAIGKKSKSQLSAHWKTIDPTRNDTTATNEKEISVGQDNKQEKKKAKAEKDREEGLKRQAEKQKQGNLNEHPININAKSSRDNGLKELAEKYDKQKWMTVASKHFDLTGQRISPAQARKMAEQK